MLFECMGICVLSPAPLSWIGGGGGKGFFENIFRGVCRLYQVQGLYSESELIYFTVVWRVKSTLHGQTKCGQKGCRTGEKHALLT